MKFDLKKTLITTAILAFGTFITVFPVKAKINLLVGLKLHQTMSYQTNMKKDAKNGQETDSVAMERKHLK